MENDLVALKQRWLETRAFEDEQAYLAARVRLGRVQFVSLDPDETLPPWLVVVVRSATGVVYGTQCAGVATEERLIEGYLVLLGGPRLGTESEPIDLASLNDVFHEGDACMWKWKGRDFPNERLARLRALIETIPYWQCILEGRDTGHRLRIDASRIHELAEAWVPVETPDGPGVVLYKNCD